MKGSLVRCLSVWSGVSVCPSVPFSGVRPCVLREGGRDGWMFRLPAAGQGEQTHKRKGGELESDVTVGCGKGEPLDPGLVVWWWWWCCCWR